MIGARVVKTAVAVTISIGIAQSFNLHTFQFAGIVAVLSVQPSIYRSLRNALQLTASAVIAALLGALALHMLGGNFYAMGLLAFVLMALHVKIRWTSSLLVSVVVGINTMGLIGLDFKEAAMNQIALVLIGVITGTVVNFIRKPVHQERAEIVLKQSDSMLRVLLDVIIIDLENNRITPYPFIVEQIGEIGGYVRKGKEIAGFVEEDRKFRASTMNVAKIFDSFDRMLRRIHDISKALASVEPIRAENEYVSKALKLVERMQGAIVMGKRVNAARFKRTVENKREQMWKALDGSVHAPVFMAYYNVYGYLLEYVDELSLFLVAKNGGDKRRLTYISIDRPGLLAEVSAVLQRHELNITNVSMKVSGNFATTTIEVSGQADVKRKEVETELMKVVNVLDVEFAMHS